MLGPERVESLHDLRFVHHPSGSPRGFFRSSAKQYAVSIRKRKRWRLFTIKVFYSVPHLTEGGRSHAEPAPYGSRDEAQHAGPANHLPKPPPLTRCARAGLAQVAEIAGEGSDRGAVAGTRSCPRFGPGAGVTISACSACPWSARSWARRRACAPASGRS